MPRKPAMLLSGAVTAFVLMVVLGLVYGANRFSVAAAAPANGVIASTADQGAAFAARNGGNTSASSTAQVQQLQTQVQQLQQQVQAYRQQLQQSYSDLQQAYDQIQQLNSQQASGGRRFRGEGSQGSSLFGGSFEER